MYRHLLQRLESKKKSGNEIPLESLFEHIKVQNDTDADNDLTDIDSDNVGADEGSNRKKYIHDIPWQAVQCINCILIQSLVHHFHN